MHNGTQGSRIAGFSRLGRDDRLASLVDRAGLAGGEVAELLNGALSFEAADHFIENAIGVLGLPLGVGLNFLINCRIACADGHRGAPVIAAASGRGRRRARRGFEAAADPACMIGQIHPRAYRTRRGAGSVWKAPRRASQPRTLCIESRPAGRARAPSSSELPDRKSCGPVLVVHLVVDVGDAVGANIGTRWWRRRAGRRVVVGRRAALCILSNLADRRSRGRRSTAPSTCCACGPDGGEVARRVVEAWELAAADPYRAATHNKGVMNGIDAVALATGNDWRGIEAGAHAWAARNGSYGPLTTWTLDGDALRGAIELPLAVATVGGHLELNPRARLSLRVIGAASTRDMAAGMAAAGLEQKLAALRALVTEGIQRGHMALHARGLALRARASS
jgi:hydroxymethylglutaryl-CoA reductase